MDFEVTRPKYRIFPEKDTGRLVDLMPVLVSEKRVPLETFDIMDARLEFKDSKNEDELRVHGVRNDNYFFVGTGSLQSSDGSLMVTYGALNGINPESKLVNGGLDMTGVDLRKINGERFTESQLGRMIFGRALTRDEAKAHGVWLAHAGGDKGRLRDYVDFTFDETKRRFGYDTNMGLYLTSKPKTPNMRSWCVGGLGNGSDAGGGSDLDGCYGRLVGKATESQTREKK